LGRGDLEWELRSPIQTLYDDYYSSNQYTKSLAKKIHLLLISSKSIILEGNPSIIELGPVCFSVREEERMKRK